MDDIVSKAMRNRENILGPLVMPTQTRKETLKSGYTDERVTNLTFNSHLGYILTSSNVYEHRQK
jgi:hypothetical protein